MVLNIKDAETDRLARAVARAAGESLTQAVATALEERLDRLAGASRQDVLEGQLTTIALRCAALPSEDERSEAEILGYDEQGLPTR